MKWHFRLDGDTYDLHGIRGLFGDEVKFHEDEQERIYLVMELEYGSEAVTAARSVAEELLAKLNAIVQIVHGNHQNARLGRIACEDPSGGPMQQFLYLNSGIRGRSRVGVPGLIVTNAAGESISPPAKLVGDRFLEAADKDENFERALYLLGSLPLDWRGLYMVLEAAEDAHDGERGLIAKNWVPSSQIKNFKDTANSYKAIRLAARHGSTKKGSDTPKISLEEAETMVRTILEHWAKSRNPR